MAYVLIIEALEEVIIGYLNAWPPETCERPLNKVSIDTYLPYCNGQSER